MFCENCGAQNPDNSKFCTTCGAKHEIPASGPAVQQPVPPSAPQQQQAPAPPFPPQAPQQQVPVQQFQQQPFVPKKRKKVFIPVLIVIAVLVVALVSGFVYAYMQSTPEAGAERYCRSLMNKDGNAFLENSFIPKATTDAQKNTIKENIKDLDTSKMDKNSLKTYSTRPAEFIGELDTSINLDGTATADFKPVYISLVVDNKINYSVIYLVKSGKSFLIFDKWVVAGSKDSARSVTGVALDKTTASMEAGKTLTLTATISPTDASNTSVTWQSSDTNIATVSSLGMVTAIKSGVATITVTTTDGSKTAICAITVTQPVTGVKLSKNRLTLKKYKTYTLKATVNPSDANNKKVTWKSSNKKIATVSSTGKIKALRKGVTYIIVYTDDGRKSDKCRVAVK